MIFYDGFITLHMKDCIASARRKKNGAQENTKSSNTRYI